MCRIFRMIIMQRMVTSSTAAIRKSLEQRLQVLKSQSTHLGNLTKEDMATQAYLKQLLENKGYTVSILNGGLSIEEMNAALREFREKTSIYISTDAGGESYWYREYQEISSASTGKRAGGD